MINAAKICSLLLVSSVSACHAVEIPSHQQSLRGLASQNDFAFPLPVWIRNIADMWNRMLPIYESIVDEMSSFEDDFDSFETETDRAITAFVRANNLANGGNADQARSALSQVAILTSDALETVSAMQRTSIVCKELLENSIDKVSQTETMLEKELKNDNRRGNIVTLTNTTLNSVEDAEKAFFDLMGTINTMQETLAQAETNLENVNDLVTFAAATDSSGVVLSYSLDLTDDRMVKLRRISDDLTSEMQDAKDVMVYLRTDVLTADNDMSKLMTRV